MQHILHTDIKELCIVSIKHKVKLLLVFLIVKTGNLAQKRFFSSKTTLSETRGNAAL